jgi:hypothetical protein
MGNLILILLGAFLVVADYTVQKSDINLDFKHDPKMKREVIYFDRIEFNDGYRVITQDSVVNYYKGKNEVTWD